MPSLSFTPSPGLAEVNSMASRIRAYSVPVILFALAMFFQLVVLPRSYPPTHYDALGISRYSSMDEVKEAYEKLSLEWNSSAKFPDATEFVKIRYAYELLTNPIKKRDYDIFGLDELQGILEKISKQYAEKGISESNLPLLDATLFEPGDHSFRMLTSENFDDAFQSSSMPWLVQVYSNGSIRCAEFYHDWKRIAVLLDEVAYTGMVDLGEVQLAAYLAEKKPTGRPFFRNGLPVLIAFPQGCKTADCLIRYRGQLSVDGVTDWFATSVLHLPRIRYYTKGSLVREFLVKSSPHKVKAIFFSKTGERATPIVRQAAKDYWAYISFAFVLWREEESSFWENAFGIESAPAIVFLKDPGVKPLVYHGFLNSSSFRSILEKNKQYELPQLRSLTSMELGCDSHGYSRAGANTRTWYCVILAGRQSEELNEMRETMRRVQEDLSDKRKVNAVATDDSFTATDAGYLSLPAAIALKDRRLTFAWLDGETQQKYCFFYIHSDTSYDSCGPRRDVTDRPRLFIVRYERGATEESMDRKPKSMWVSSSSQEVDPVSQLVALYDGPSEVAQIIQWISNIVKDGDSNKLPSFRTKTPELVPEDGKPISSGSAYSIFSPESISGITGRFYDLLEDPRIGPFLMLGALMSFGAIWLFRNQQTHHNIPSQPTQSSAKEEEQAERRRVRNASKKDIRPSITDEVPANAYQMPLLDSDSDSD